MYRLKDVKIRKNISDEEVLDVALKKSGISKNEVTFWKIYKKSIDARNKDDVHFVYTIDVELKDKQLCNGLLEVKEFSFPEIKNNRKSNLRPVIVGAGPAGLFAGLILARYGANPIIIEQGKTVTERKKDVEEFKKTGKLNINSNVQFGEGGAGTFSDGKLNTGISSKCYTKYEK